MAIWHLRERIENAVKMRKQVTKQNIRTKHWKIEELHLAEQMPEKCPKTTKKNPKEMPKTCKNTAPKNPNKSQPQPIPYAKQMPTGNPKKKRKKNPQINILTTLRVCW